MPAFNFRTLATVSALVLALTLATKHSEHAKATQPVSQNDETLPTEKRDISAYSGLGSWVDIYDDKSFNNPEKAIREMASRGVKALHLETSNFSRKVDIVRPDRTARFIRAAHAADIQVVAWYLPGFKDLRLDLRRTLAAVNFRTKDGQQFDSFELDIESSAVRSPRERSRRLIMLSDRIRRRVGPQYPLGAIIPSPRGMEIARSWPGFPYRQLTRFYDAWVPMNYFTYRPATMGYQGAYNYTKENIARIRAQTGNPNVPIHIIGGVASKKLDSQTMRGFVDAVSEGNVFGASLYSHDHMLPAHWNVMAEVTLYEGVG